MASDSSDDVGLCADCRYGRPQPTTRGSIFWRCLRAETDPRFVRYPPLPVVECPGYDPDDVSGKT